METVSQFTDNTSPTGISGGIWDILSSNMQIQLESREQGAFDCCLYFTPSAVGVFFQLPVQSFKQINWFIVSHGSRVEHLWVFLCNFQSFWAASTKVCVVHLLRFPRTNPHWAFNQQCLTVQKKQLRSSYMLTYLTIKCRLSRIDKNRIIIFYSPHFTPNLVLLRSASRDSCILL